MPLRAAGRAASAKELAKGCGAVLKDLDFVGGGCSLRCACAGEQAAWEVLALAMGRDARWLASCGLIDYSLLLGFARCAKDEAGKKALSHVTRLDVDPAALGTLLPRLEQRLEATRPSASEGGAEWARDGSGAKSGTDTGACPPTLVVYFGIIDCLMPYGLWKRCENLLLDRVLSADISCQPPVKYAERFGEFVLRMGGDAGALAAYTRARQAAAARPLGRLIGEVGRKDVWRLVQKRALLPLVAAGVAMVGWRAARRLR